MASDHCPFAQCQVHSGNDIGLAILDYYGYGEPLTEKPRGMKGVTMDACPTCMGDGLDPTAPSRTTRDSAPQRAVLTMVRPCPDCDGRGVLPEPRERDLMRPRYFARRVADTVLT